MLDGSDFLEKYNFPDEPSQIFNEKMLKDLTIISRILPEHKIEILKAYQEQKLKVGFLGETEQDIECLNNADVGLVCKTSS